MTEEIPSFTTLMDDGAPTGAPTFSLRLVERSDEAMLLRIFAESHCAGFELMGLAPAALDGLVRMQFQARQAQYRTHPGAAEYLICQNGVPVGSCWLGDSAQQLRVLDIAVLAGRRRQGIARSVLSQLCARAAAAGIPVGLSVWHDNAPARELYRGLGFTAGDTGRAGDGDLGNGYLELQFLPDRAPELQAGAR